MGRPVAVLAFVLVAFVLTGCGTLSHALRAGATPTVAIDSRVAPAAAPAMRPPSMSASAPDFKGGDESRDVRAATGDRDWTALIDDAVAGLAGRGSETAARDPEICSDPSSCDGGADVVTTGASSVNDDGESPMFMAAQAEGRAERKAQDEYDVEEYDPWESFNEVMFEFNRKLDRYVLKPVAKAYDRAMPDELQRMIANAFDNIGSPIRFVNSVLQGKFRGAGREASRFLINTVIGIAGFWDMAKQEWGIEKSREDFGQTLGVWGFGPGPYLILPFLPPLTVRDGVGFVADGFINPLRYFTGFFPERFALEAENAVNERSLNLELFQGFEETVVDMYSAVRHAYLERRKNLIKE